MCVCAICTFERRYMYLSADFRVMNATTCKCLVLKLLKPNTHLHTYTYFTLRAVCTEVVCNNSDCWIFSCVINNNFINSLVQLIKHMLFNNLVVMKIFVSVTTCILPTNACGNYFLISAEKKTFLDVFHLCFYIFAYMFA